MTTKACSKLAFGLEIIRKCSARNGWNRKLTEYFFVCKHEITSVVTVSSQWPF